MYKQGTDQSTNDGRKGDAAAALVPSTGHLLALVRTKDLNSFLVHPDPRTSSSMLAVWRRSKGETCPSDLL